MRTGPFNNRSIRNEIRSGRYGDPFNTAYKFERHKEPKEFSTREVEEIKRFSQMKDARTSRYRRRARSTGGQSSGKRFNKTRSSVKGFNKSRSSGNAVRKLTNALFRQAVVMVAGAVVLTNSYLTMVEKREAKQANAFTEAAETAETDDQVFGNDDGMIGVAYWTWAKDHSSASVIVLGVGRVDATVSVTEEPPGCVTEGTRIFTAAAVVKGTTYTDTVTEPIPATGHSFGEAQIRTDEDGKRTLVYHCDGCGQDFEIGFSAEEAEE